jgi:nitric oxide reductase NorQ protein
MSQTQSAIEAPYYLSIGDEIDIFRAAYDCRLPVLLKGPTGCGKTRFVEYMAYTIAGERGSGETESTKIPGNLITVACHEDLTGSDLVGRYLIKGDDTVWIDGPLTQAARLGSVCYLDEVVEARKDTIVLIHPLTITGVFFLSTRKARFSKRTQTFCSSSRTTPATRVS